MYWNLFFTHANGINLAININMRCIEMCRLIKLAKQIVWLTLTWDVLKSGRTSESIWAYRD